MCILLWIGWIASTKPLAREVRMYEEVQYAGKMDEHHAQEEDG